MGSKGAKRKSSLEEKPQYPLEEVKRLIQEGKCEILPSALIRTQRELRWTAREVFEVVSRLKPGDFYKKDEQKKWPWGILDFYKPKGRIKGELVYIHFAIDKEEDKLIIDSCHKQRGSR